MVPLGCLILHIFLPVNGLVSLKNECMYCYYQFTNAGFCVCIGTAISKERAGRIESVALSNRKTDKQENPTKLY